MEELQNKTITYKGFEVVDTKIGTKYKIKDEKGLTYSFFENKKDGGQTKAYQQFAQLKVGQRIGVNYKEDKAVADGKNISYRTIMFFTEPDEQVTQDYRQPTASPTVSKPKQEAMQLLEEIKADQKIIINLLQQLTRVQKEEKVPVVHLDDEIENVNEEIASLSDFTEAEEEGDPLIDVPF